MTPATKAPPIHHTPKSSNIAAIEYHPDEHRLIVTFHNGGRYAYDEVHPDFAHKFINAPSAGSFFHKHIRTQIEGKKL